MTATRSLPDVAGMTTSEAALAYVEAGYAVFPLVPGTKASAIKEWQHNAYTTPEEVATKWPSDDHGIALALGQSGLLAVDVDTPELLPDDLRAVLDGAGTATQATRVDSPERLHHLFATDERFGNSTGAFTGIGWGDVRGAGGYIAVAPTVHPAAEAGGQYVWQRREISPLPAPLKSWLRPESYSADAVDLDDFAAAFTESRDPGRLALTIKERFTSAVEAGASRNEALGAAAGVVLREAAAGCYTGREAVEGLLEAVNAVPGKEPYEEGRAEGYLSRVAGDVLADDLDAIRDRYRPIEFPILESAEDRFWKSRRSLQTIHDFAKARYAAPWATLGVALARVVAATSPRVVLPPIVGDDASLNLHVALVGQSGGGKGAATGAGKVAVHIADPAPLRGVGSGEGLIHAYAEVPYGKGAKDVPVDEHGQHWFTDRALFNVPEVDQLAALTGGRSGSTLASFLRQAWSGEALARSTASKERNVSLPDHSYRMCLLVGVQPTRASTIFDDGGGGTPQRFLWFRTDDPDPDLDAEDPYPLAWQPPTLRDPAPFGALHRAPREVIKVCESARTTIIEARVQQLRTPIDVPPDSNLDGHALLQRLKAAAALALLEGRLEVTDEDWNLAEVLMAASNAVRNTVQQVMAREAGHEAERRGRQQGRQQAVAVEVQEEAAVKRAGAAVKRWLETHSGGDWAVRSKIRGGLVSRHRAHFDEAVEALIAAGLIEAREIDGQGQAGREYRLTA